MSIERNMVAWAAALGLAVAPAAWAETTASAAWTLEVDGASSDLRQSTDGSVAAHLATRLDADSAGRPLGWSLSSTSTQAGLQFSLQATAAVDAASARGGLVSAGGAAALLSFVDTFVVDCALCAAGSTGLLRLSVPDLAAVMAATADPAQGGGDLALDLSGGGFGAVQVRADTERTIELSVQGDNLPLPPGAGPMDSSAWWTRTEREQWRDDGGGGTAFLPVSQSATDGEIRFVFGQPVRVVLTMSASAGAGIVAWLTDDGASFAATLSREATLRFELPRVLQVFDAAGAEISGFRALGGSGLDYAAASAVPEPSTATAWLAGLLLLGARGRRRGAGRWSRR